MFLFSRGMKRLDFFFLFCVHVKFLPEVLGAVVTSDQFSRVLNDLMKKPYDKRVRPLFNEGPLFVRLGVFLESVLDFNEQASELSVTVTIRQAWLEPRLTFSRGLVPNDSVLIIPEQVKLLWNPNTIVVNQRKSIIMFENHESTRLISEGQVSTSMRMTLTTECIAQYSYFPFDTQSCDIQFTSYTKEIAFEWDDGNSGMKKSVQTPELQIASYSAHGFTRGDAHHSSPVFTILFVRKWNHYYLTFYSPMIVFTLVSLLSLWLFDPRLGVLINFLSLPLMNIFIVIGNKVSGRPRTDVSTAMDQYASLCYFFMFMCAIVSAADLYFERQDSEQKLKKEDLKDKESVDDEESGSGHSQSQELDLPATTEVKQKLSTRFKAILAKVKNAVKLLCYHSFWILLAGFLLCNLFYWGSNFSGQKSRIKSIK